MDVNHLRTSAPKVVKFLHKNRHEGCTTAAMNNAAAGGHAPILEYLGSNLAEGCTEYAMVMAAWNGHLEIVKWLHHNRAEVSAACRLADARMWRVLPGASGIFGMCHDRAGPCRPRGRLGAICP